MMGPRSARRDAQDGAEPDVAPVVGPAGELEVAVRVAGAGGVEHEGAQAGVGIDGLGQLGLGLGRSVEERGVGGGQEGQVDLMPIHRAAQGPRQDQLVLVGTQDHRHPGRRGHRRHVQVGAVEHLGVEDGVGGDLAGGRRRLDVDGLLVAELDLAETVPQEGEVLQRDPQELDVIGAGRAGGRDAGPTVEARIDRAVLDQRRDGRRPIEVDGRHSRADARYHVLAQRLRQLLRQRRGSGGAERERHRGSHPSISTTTIRNTTVSRQIRHD